MFIKYKPETPESSKKKKKIILFLHGKYENKSNNLEDQSLLNNKFSKLKLKEFLHCDYKSMERLCLKNKQTIARLGKILSIPC